MSDKEVSGQDYMIAARVLDEHGITEPCGEIESLPVWLRAEGERMIAAETAAAELDSLAHRLYCASRKSDGGTASPWANLTPFGRRRWRAVAREAIAAQTETEQPSPISADATGLKGRRAKIIGPAEWANGEGSSWFTTGDVVTISGNEVRSDGDIALVGPAESKIAYIAASSLALIPDEPVAEPPVGTRLRDKDGVIHLRDEHGWYTNMPEARDWSWPSICEHGPLHQVWESWADIPHGIEVQAEGDSLTERTLRVRHQNPAVNSGMDAHAPFIAVAEFGAGQ